MASNKSAGIVFLVLLICAGIVAAAYMFNKKKQDAPRMRGQTEFSVITQEVKEETLHAFIAANGEIESQNSVSVFPDIAGKIISTEVLLGSSVRRGQVIAYIDPSQPGERYNRSPVYAPIAGSIISPPVKNGTTVSVSTAITQIGDIANLQITADIPERFVAFLQPGLKALVSVEAYPDLSFDATVTRVSPVVDAVSRTKQIILQFDKRDARINAGMFAKIILYTRDYSGAVTMPAHSLVINNNKHYAYVVRDDATVEQREVTLGENVSGIVQIISGLKEGERVVVQGQTSLSDGAKIRDISMQNIEEAEEQGEDGGEV